MNSFLRTKRTRTFLATPTQKSIKELLAFLNLCQNVKTQFISSPDSYDTVNFESHDQDWPHPFLTKNG